MGVILSLLAIVLFIGALALEGASCHSRWDSAKIGNVTFGPIQGCMIEYPDGKKQIHDVTDPVEWLLFLATELERKA